MVGHPQPEYEVIEMEEHDNWIYQFPALVKARENAPDYCQNKEGHEDADRGVGFSFGQG